MMSVSSSTENAPAKTLPPLSNEIFGLIIESLGEDIPSLRSCSLVSSVFRHFCCPVLYRDIELDCKEKLETFFQLGEQSDSLIHSRSLGLTYEGFGNKTHQRKPRKILDIISQKASLETLRLHHVQFQADPFTVSLLCKLSTVTVLVVQQCYFGGFEDFVSFIRCFPRCQVLRLHRCTWARDVPTLRFSDLPAPNISPAHLDIMCTSVGRWRRLFDQGKIVGLPWLNLAGLKSFKYVVQDDTTSGPVLSHIATCGLLEEVDMGSGYSSVPVSATANLALFITRIKSLTLRCHFELSPWWSPGSLFPSSLTLERIRIVTPGPFTTFKGWKVLDDTFSDIDRYPALVELELCSLKVTEVGGKIMMRDTYERLCADEYLPRLKALGRLPVCSSARPVESVRPVVTFGSIADAYYKNSV